MPAPTTTPEKTCPYHFAVKNTPALDLSPYQVPSAVYFSNNTDYFPEIPVPSSPGAKHGAKRKNPRWSCARLVVGAFVFRPAPPGTAGGDQMLIIQRAVEEPWAPNLWEVPGGGIEETDASVLHATARELWEEAGLVARRFVALPLLQHWAEDRPGKLAAVRHTDAQGRPVAPMWRKVMFEVDVESVDEVRLDPREHQRFAWVGEDEVRRSVVGTESVEYMTEETRLFILEGFARRRERLAAARKGGK